MVNIIWDFVTNKFKMSGRFLGHVGQQVRSKGVMQEY